MSDASSDIERSWVLAGHYSEILKQVPTLFSSCVKTLRQDNLDRVPFLIKVSPSLRLAFYVAAREMEKEKLDSLNPLNTKGLLKALSPTESSAVVALLFLYKRVQRFVEDKDELNRVNIRNRALMEISALVGETIEGIGIGNGLLIGGIRGIASTLFLIKDPDNFKKLRRKLTQDKKLFDLREEEALWGCNHLQIASKLLNKLGFGLKISTCISLAMNRSHLSIPEGAKVTEEELKCWHATMLWSESLQGHGGPPPGITEEDEMYLPEESIKDLQRQVQDIMKKDRCSLWLDTLPNEIEHEILKALEIDEKKIKTPD